MKDLMSFKHYIYYYGRNDIADVKMLLDKYHNIPEHQKDIIAPIKFIELDNINNQVYFVDYDMVQSEITMMSKGSSYDIETESTTLSLDEDIAAKIIVQN